MVKPKLREEPESRWDRDGHKVTVIETEHGARYCDLPLKDFDLLMDLYDSLPHPKLKNPQWDFVTDINWRIYTEWCMNTEWKKHQSYHGDGFKDFVREETHIELVREGYHWNKQENRFDELTPEQYEQVRYKVLGGLTLKSIDLFSDWDGTPHPQSRTEKDENGFIKYICTDPRNLRGSLTDYVTRYDSLRQQTLCNK